VRSRRAGPQDADGVTWYQVQYAGQSGWVDADFISARKLANYAAVTFTDGACGVPEAVPVGFLLKPGTVLWIVAPPPSGGADAHRRRWARQVAPASAGMSTIAVDAMSPPWRRHAPRQGEHTAEVMAEAGCSAEEIAAITATTTPADTREATRP